MMRLLSIILTFFILSSIFFLHPQAAHAQSAKQPAGLLNLIILKELLIAQQSNQAIPSTTIPTQTPELSPIPTAGQSAITKLTTNPTESGQMPTPSSKNLPLVSPTIVPTPTPLDTNQTTDVKTYIMTEINKYRALRGLGAVQTSSETCSFAKLRAEEISKNFNHDGFNHQVDTKTLPYSHWSKVSENLATTPNYKEVVTLWENSPAHANNMREATPFVCVEQYGNYFAYEGIKP